jgi:hypothetical protein
LENARVDYGHTPDYGIEKYPVSVTALRRIAQDALVELVKNSDTPAAVRAAGARTLLELCGAIGAKRIDVLDNDTDPETMTIRDIDQRLKDLDGI